MVPDLTHWFAEYLIFVSIAPEHPWNHRKQSVSAEFYTSSLSRAILDQVNIGAGISPDLMPGPGADQRPVDARGVGFKDHRQMV